MRPAQVRGFTLVELLVVIAIIGTLVALLLPAVQRARESSRRSSCLNNIRQFALATLQYEERLNRFPGLFEKLTGQFYDADDSTSGLVHNITWAVALLPGLERQSVHDDYAAGRHPGTFVEIYVCPSDGDKGRSGPSTSYVANGGRVASVVFQRVQNGPFLNRIFDPDAAALEGHWIDGREYTLILSENIDALYYDEIGWNGFEEVVTYKIDGTFVVEDQDDRTWSPVFLWAGAEGSTQKQTRINSPGLDLDNVKWEESKRPRRFTSQSTGAVPGRYLASWARPSSRHGGGVNVAFSSGRVMFLREDIDYRVYIALMTLHDLKSDSPNPEFQLEDKHYR